MGYKRTAPGVIRPPFFGATTLYTVSNMRSLLLASVITAQVAAQPHTTLNLFMETVIESLAVAADAYSSLSKPAADDQEQMTNTRISINKMAEAQRLVTPFLTGDDLISPVASDLSTVYRLLGRLLGEGLRNFERVIAIEARIRDGERANLADEIEELKVSTRRLAAQTESAWKLLPQTIGISTDILIDWDRQDGRGRHPFFRVTAKEQVELESRLEHFFGRSSLQRNTQESQHAVEVAPLLLWQFLNQPGWKAADVP